MKTFSEYFADRTRSVDLSNKKLFDSASLFAEMAVLNPHAIGKAQSALQFINTNKIQGVLIGGLAVAHYTADRPITPDVDFLITNMPAVLQLLDIQHIGHTALASDGAYEGIHIPALDADFLDAHKGNTNFNQYILRTAKPGRIGGVSFPIIDPNVLTILKFSLDRTKDTDDAFKLLPILKKAELKLHLQALKNYLRGDIDAKTIWQYAQHLSQN